MRDVTVDAGLPTSSPTCDGSYLAGWKRPYASQLSKLLLLAILFTFNTAFAGPTILKATTEDAIVAYYYSADGTLKYVENLAGVNSRQIRLFIGEVPPFPSQVEIPSDLPRQIQMVNGAVGAEVIAIAVYYGVTCKTHEVVRLAAEDLAKVSRRLKIWHNEESDEPPDCRCKCIPTVNGCQCPPQCR